MKTSILNSLLAALALSFASTGLAAAEDHGHSPGAQAARADITKTLGFVPSFLDIMPDVTLPGAWEEMKGLQLNPGTALPGRVKELIGLAVAGQVPCKYCTYAHTEFAKLNGATSVELGEAVSVGALERHWSAYFYGMQVDETKYRAEISRIVESVKKPATAPTTKIQVVDAKSALQDIEQTLGFVPEFLRKVPESALPGAWRELKDVKLSNNTTLSAKNKALIALAVASQVPSRACIMSETEFAKLAGANDREIAEAVGMAAITRNLSTVFNGLQLDEHLFRTDIDHLVRNVKAGQKKAANVTASRTH